jgi:hypothetical protein
VKPGTCSASVSRSIGFIATYSSLNDRAHRRIRQRLVATASGARVLATVLDVNVVSRLEIALRSKAFSVATSTCGRVFNDWIQEATSSDLLHSRIVFALETCG